MACGGGKGGGGDLAFRVEKRGGIGGNGWFAFGIRWLSANSSDGAWLGVKEKEESV